MYALRDQRVSEVSQTQHVHNSQEAESAIIAQPVRTTQLAEFAIIAQPVFKFGSIMLQFDLFQDQFGKTFLLLS